MALWRSQKGRMVEIGEDDKYFIDVAEYYKETYNLDVLDVLGMRLEEGCEE